MKALKTEIIFDKVYEKSMEARLKITCDLLQKLVDGYNALGLKQCLSAPDLWALVHHTKSMVQAGQYASESDIEGLTDAQASDYLRKLHHKNPHQVYAIARECQSDPYTESGQSLWVVKDGKVTLNRKEAESILKKRSVFAQNEKQLETAKDMMELRRIYNKINQDTGGRLHTLTGELFQPMGRPNQEQMPRSFDIEAIRKIIASV